jgi:hypothetical protein
MLLAICLAIVVAFLLVFAIDARRVHPGGPLSDFVGNGVGATIKPGQPISIGGFPLRNRGDVPVIVDRVTLIDPEPGLRVLGIYAVRTTEVGAMRGYAPPATARYPVNLGLGAGEHYELVVGLTADKSGLLHASHGVRVEYHTVSGRKYATALGIEIAVCATTKDRAGSPRCPR